MNELEELTRSLQKDAGLPKVKSTGDSVRTLEVVKAEIDAANLQADKIAETALFLSDLVAKLLGRLDEIEAAEKSLLAATLRHLKEEK